MAWFILESKFWNKLLIFYYVIRIFAAADAPIDWEPVDVSPVKHADGTMGIPRAAIDSVNKNKVRNLKIPAKLVLLFLLCLAIIHIVL